jgi:hypothetical protein
MNHESNNKREEEANKGIAKVQRSKDPKIQSKEKKKRK